jgi:hypothetical protein
VTRVRATLGPDEAARLQAALAPVPRTWRDRFWDAQPWLGLLALVWLALLTAAVAWLVWHS